MSKKLNTRQQSSEMARTSVKRKDSDSNNNSKSSKSQRTSSRKSPELSVDDHEDDYHSVQGSEEGDEPRFTFEEVKTMIDGLLSKQTRASPAVSAGLKRVNFNEIVIGDHSVKGCKELIEQMVQATRRVRTLQEVLLDIKDNLNKRVYTEIIHRATMKGDLPKKPPSAYLLYHQDRYNELREENSLAVEVSKIVAEEWKVLPEKKRREYQRRHEELVRKYESDMERLGLIDEAAPKRPKPAKTLYIEYTLSNYNTETWSKETLASERERIGQSYDNLPSNERQQWIDTHARNLRNYLKEREEYILAHPHLNHSLPERKNRASEKAKLPEPPKSAQKFFLMKKIPADTDPTQYDELKKRFKEKFQHLREKKLLKYIKKAVQDKERYDKEIEEYKRHFPGRVIPKTKPNITKEQMKLYAKVVENRPLMPAPTAYLHYCGKILTDMNDNDDEQVPTARMQTASQSWKESSNKDKRTAEKAHMADIERYIREMEAWLATRPEERRTQVLTEEPKANPDYWKKKLNRIKKIELKKKEQKNQAATKAATVSPATPRLTGSPLKNQIKMSPSSKLGSPNKYLNNQQAYQYRTPYDGYTETPATYFSAYQYNNN